MKVVISDAVSNNVQISFSSVNWNYRESSNYFEFNFTIKTFNPFTSNYSYSFDTGRPPYRVETYYIGNYKVGNIGKGGGHLCCIKAYIKPGINYKYDLEGIKVLNYSSTIIPDGIYIFSIDKVFGSSNVITYSNTTLIMNLGKESVYYNTSIYSTGISFFIQQNLLLIGFLISIMVAIPISYFRFIKKQKNEFIHLKLSKNNPIHSKFINKKFKKNKSNHNNTEDTRFDHFFDDIGNILENQKKR